MATVEIVTGRYPSTEIDLDALRADSATLAIFFVWNESVTGFTASDITLTNATGEAFRGSGCSYEYVITPTGNDGDAVTVAVAADAVTEGNPATTLTVNHADDTIEVSELFGLNTTTESRRGIAVSPTRIYIASFDNVLSRINIRAYMHDGTEVSAEILRGPISGSFTFQDAKLDWLNGRVIVSWSYRFGANYRRNIENVINNTLSNLFEFVNDITLGFDNSISTVNVPTGITHNDYGIVGVIDAGFGVFPYNGNSASDAQNTAIDGVVFHNTTGITASGNRIYTRVSNSQMRVYRWTGATSVEFEKVFHFG